MKNKTPEYPRLKALTVSVRQAGIAYARADELAAKRGPEKTRQFDSLFGVQACPVIERETKKNGDHASCLYPWDVEAVPELMESGKLTGTHSFSWDPSIRMALVPKDSPIPQGHITSQISLGG